MTATAILLIYLSGFLPVEAWTTAPAGQCPAPYVQYGDQVLPMGERGKVICIVPAKRNGEGLGDD